MGQKVTLIMKSLQCDTSPSVQIQNNFSLLCNDSSSPADERNAVTRRFYRLCQFHFLLPVTVWGLHQHHTAAAMIDNTNTQTNILSSLITQCETTHNCETISLSSFLFHKTTERLWNNLRHTETRNIRAVKCREREFPTYTEGVKSVNGAGGEAGDDWYVADTAMKQTSCDTVEKDYEQQLWGASPAGRWADLSADTCMLLCGNECSQFSVCADLFMVWQRPGYITGSWPASACVHQQGVLVQYLSVDGPVLLCRLRHTFSTLIKHLKQKE